MDALGRMIRRGVALKKLYLAVPCRFTGWLLTRQVDRIERAMPPPASHVRETFGRLRFRHKPPPTPSPLAEHPAALGHKARLERDLKEVEYAEAWAEFQEALAALPKPSRRYRSVESRNGGRNAPRLR